MQLTLDRLTYPWLQPKYFDMRLLDSNCRPFHVNVTHVIVKTKHEECNTVRTNSPGGVIYRNILMALLRPQPGRLVTRVPNVLFPFQCRFDPKKVASISSKNNLKMITPIGNEVVSMNTFEVVIRLDQNEHSDWSPAGHHRHHHRRVSSRQTANKVVSFVVRAAFLKH